MQRFALPIGLAITALLIGIGIGRFTVSSAGDHAPRTTATVANEPATSADPVNPRAVPPKQSAAPSKSNPSAPVDSAENIIAKIKTGLTQFNSRHAYATFSKLAEAIDSSNVREVLAFVQTLPKPQEKSMLISLFVARWAELEPQAAIAYAEALPPGTSRNWALTSAVTGWAERDSAAATAWVQQLPTGPVREQALQTVVSALAEKDPASALAFLENLPPGRN